MDEEEKIFNRLLDTPTKKEESNIKTQSQSPVFIPDGEHPKVLRREYQQLIIEKMKTIDNLEFFLIYRLGGYFEMIKEAWVQYTNGDIQLGQLVHSAINVLREKFVDLFVERPKPVITPIEQKEVPKKMTAENLPEKFKHVAAKTTMRTNLEAIKQIGSELEKVELTPMSFGSSDRTEVRIVNVGSSLSPPPKKPNLSPTFARQKREIEIQESSKFIDLIIKNITKLSKENSLMGIDEIRKYCNSTEDQVENVLINMIHNKQIYAKYFKESKRVLFDKESNKLLAFKI